MFHIAERCRDNARRTRTRASRPALENLEGRLLLYATTGDVFSMPQRITYSFIPDGTSVGGTPSSLFQTMNGMAATATWEAAIEQAAAVWQQVANVNFALVSDNGEPLGSNGDQQDDPNIADIRIGAIPLNSQNLVAGTFAPPPNNGGTLAGDMMFNSQLQWGIGTNYDLETVAIHEFGHELGLGESAISTAVMYGTYNGIKQSLTSDDITGVQSVMGAYPGYPSNDSSSSPITMTPGTNGEAAVSGQYVSDANDDNWYAVTVPSGTNGTMVVTMQSTDLSSLSPRLAVYNDSTGTLVSVGQTAAANVYGATVSYTVTGVTAGQIYDFRASAANTGAGSNGAYGLTVNFAIPPAWSAAAASSGSTERVVAVGQDGNLYTDYNNGTNWAWNKVGAPSGTTLVGSPAMVTAGSSQTVFVRGANGNLYENTWTGSAWTGFANFGAPSGTTVGSDPALVNYGSGGQTVFIRGANGSLYVDSWNGSSWSGWINFGAPSGTTLASNPTLVDYGASGQTVFIRGTDGNLYVDSWCGSAWSGLIKFAAPSGASFVGNPSMVDYGTSGQMVYSTASNGNLYEYDWNGSAWYLFNLGNPGSGVSVIGNPTPVNLSTPGQQSIYVAGSDGQLHWDTWNNSTWTWSTSSSAAPISTAAPTVINPGTGSQAIFVTTLSGDLTTGTNGVTQNLGDPTVLLSGNPIALPNTLVASAPNQGSGAMQAENLAGLHADKTVKASDIVKLSAKTLLSEAHKASLKFTVDHHPRGPRR